jgi:hypothetical protein
VASATNGHGQRPRRDSLFSANLHAFYSGLGTSSAKTNKRLSQQQAYVSARKAQLDPWTAFLRNENHEDDPVHICVCVCVCFTVVLNLACVYTVC